MNEKKKILLIDDEAVIQTLCRRLLTRMGYDLTIAGGVKEALQEIQNLPAISMLITDLRLPDGDSMDAIRRVRQKYPTVKMLMITGSLTIAEEKMKQLAETGITDQDILFKPFETKEFESAIQQRME